MLVRDQLLLSPMGDIIGLNHSSIHSLLDMHEVENKKWMFEQILLCDRIEQEISKGKTE